MFRSALRALRAAMLGILALMSLYSLAAGAQPAAATGTAPLTAEQVDQLVAPIALYPDPLLAQILMAATYPLEIVEADRWRQSPENAALKGDALAAALQQQPWDPSVKSLVAFPQLLHMMDANLQWTEQLGDAFLAQQADVMDAVQRLRRRAQSTGTLASTPQQTVSTVDQEIMIEPANPEIVYVPAYNPWCVYGAWPAPDYPPVYFGSWSGECAPAESFISFGVAFYPFAYWAWGRLEWRHHRIRIDHDRFQRFHPAYEPPEGIWQHDPAHRRGVPYRNPETAARFPAPARPEIRVQRGFGPAPEAVQPTKPAVPSVEHGPAAIIRPEPGPSVPQQRSPPAFESFGSGAQVRGEAARGLSSRTAPVLPPAPAPSFHPAPMPSFHGGGRR